jgi:hypothetical protein
MESPEVIPYASPNMAKPRITFRGAVATLIVGGGFLILSITLLTIAWSIFKNYAETGNYRAGSLESLGVFVCILAGISFLCGMIIVFVGLRGVRQREIA